MINRYIHNKGINIKIMDIVENVRVNMSKRRLEKERDNERKKEREREREIIHRGVSCNKTSK